MSLRGIQMQIVPRLSARRQGQRQRLTLRAESPNLLDLDNQVRAVGNNLNQMTRYSRQGKELAEGREYAIAAAMRACVQIGATARWVMGKPLAVSVESLVGTLLADAVDTSGWADSVDPDRSDAAVNRTPTSPART
ncbi:hypothetical protein [Nocardia sp. NPDC050717]|uniref:hypothetical protein n=1 Tax=Nocardia sp. NPDC050717 TaxID=3157221 RepID=UPI0033ECDC2F